MSRSTSTVVCGLSIFKSVSTKKNMPLARALSSTACETSFSRSKFSVVLITNCSGSPREPGSAGNWNAATVAPG